MDNEKERALEHVAKIRTALQKVEASAARLGDETLTAEVAELHDLCGAARDDYFAARELTDDEDVADDSGGENKPPKTGG